MPVASRSRTSSQVSTPAWSISRISSPTCNPPRHRGFRGPSVPRWSCRRASRPWCVEQPEDDEGEDEVRPRTGRDDEGAGPHGLGLELPRFRPPLRTGRRAAPRPWTRILPGESRKCSTRCPLLLPIILGGKPRENRSTLMPMRLAARKWPSSWKKTSNPRTKIADNTVVSMPMSPFYACRLLYDGFRCCPAPAGARQPIQQYTGFRHYPAINFSRRKSGSTDPQPLWFPV